MSGPDASDDPVAVSAGAARLFGLDPVSIDVQLSESTTVARVHSPSGTFAIKIFDAHEVDTPLTEWRHRIAAHAAARGLPVPRPLLSTSGALTERAVLGGTRRLIQASAWSVGSPLADYVPDPALLHHIGATAARLVVALIDAPPPPVHELHTWDLRRSDTTLTHALTQATDPATRVLGLRALRVFHAWHRRLDDLPHAIVHHDLHDDNLRIGATAEGTRVVGILDFGDATRGPRVTDLIVAAAYSVRRSDRPQDAIGDVVAGWSRVLPLTPEEEAVVRPLAAVRLATNAAVWHARSRGPRAEYARQRAHGSLRAAAALLDSIDRSA
jgi:Ser/Thr protein kinase RdoA (MazF antagonist)